MLRSMKMIVSAFLIASASLFSQATFAAPATSSYPAASPAPKDDMEQMLAEKGLLYRLDKARQTITSGASELVIGAMGSLGVPYRRGGTSAETGFDCSGFVRAIYEQSIGHLLPRKADQQAAATQQIDKTELQPGDLVFFNTLRRSFSHVGIYLGNGKFIHSPKPGAQVRIESMSISYWSERFDGARRVTTGSAAVVNPVFMPNAIPVTLAPVQSGVDSSSYMR